MHTDQWQASRTARLPGARGVVAAGAGAGAGAASGGLIGALIGGSIPQERVKDDEEGIKQGGILMGLRARSPEDAVYFANEWQTVGGRHIYS